MAESDDDWWHQVLRMHADEARHVVVVDEHLTIRAMTEADPEDGLPGPEVMGQPALGLLHPDDLERAANVMADVLHLPGARPPGMYRVKTGDGFRAMDIAAVNATDAKGERPVAIAYLINELDDRRRAEALATDQVEVMSLLASAQPIETCLLALTQMAERHIDGVLVAITRTFENAPAEVVAGPDLLPFAREANQLATANDLPPNAAEAAKRGLATLSASGRGANGHQEGSLVTTPIFSSENDLYGYVETYRDSGGRPTNGEWSVFDLVARLSGLFIERVKLDDQLNHAALHDPLTGLANRRLLASELERLCAENQAFALALVDLDQFSWINNTFGHTIGDVVLSETANRLLDTVGARALVARPGGDEFVVVVPGVETAAQTEELGARLHTALAAPLDELGGRRHIQASIGLIVATEDDDPERVTAAADAAMYVAKRAGGDAVHCPVELDRADQRHRYDMIRNLAAAIDNRQLHLVFQPMVDLRAGRCVNFEALVRWEREGRVVAGPEEFVALAERSNLILSLDELVLRTAGAQMTSWRADGTLPSDGVVWVNVSPRTIERSDFVELMREAAGDGGVKHLGVEVTERAVDTDPARVAASLQEVRAAGIPVALDDFGTGVASLQQLADFPASDLKIDGSFVHKMKDNPAYLTMVETIVHLGRKLGMRVTAEAIETAEQYQSLRRLGCDLGQGFFIARPMTIERLTDWQLAQTLDDDALACTQSDNIYQPRSTHS